LAHFQLGPGKEQKAANRPRASWKASEVREGNVATNVLLIFNDLYFSCLSWSERSLGGCIGLGGSSQAGEFSGQCCIGTGRLLYRRLLNTIFFYL